MKLSKTSLFIVIAFVGLLGFFGYAVIQKEAILNKGRLVLLQLAPVDPRSLMQGDYMSLNYAIAQTSERFNDSIGSRGFVLLDIDKNGVGQLVRKTKAIEPTIENQVYIKFYNNRTWNYNIGAESYFFQEGQAEKYEKALYGGLRIDNKGNSVLIGLFDKDFKQIK